MSGSIFGGSGGGGGGAPGLTDANNVAITGGSITGITDLAVADGGTGASDAATARTNLDVFSKSETVTADKYKTWTNWVIPTSVTDPNPPNDNYSWLEHIQFRAAQPFEMLVRKSSTGTQLSHYASVGQYSNTQEEIHRLFADATTDITGTSGTIDSLTSSTRIVEGQRIRSQFDSGDSTHVIWLTFGTLEDGSGNRFQLGSALNIATSIDTFSQSQAMYADQQDQTGGNFFADTALTSSAIQIDQRPMANPMTTAGDLITGGASGTPTRLAMGSALQVLRVNAGATALEFAAASGGIDQATANATAIKYAIALG